MVAIGIIGMIIGAMGLWITAAWFGEKRIRSSGIGLLILGILLFSFAAHHIDVGSPMTSLPVNRGFQVESVTEVTTRNRSRQYILLTGERFAGNGRETFLFQPTKPLNVKPGDIIKRTIIKSKPKDFIGVTPK